MFLKLICHSDSGIPADKFYCRHLWLSGWNLPAANIDMSVFSVIFHRIRQYIHHHTFHISWTSNKLPMCDFFLLPHDPDILFCRHLLDHNKYFPGNTAQIKRNFFQNHFARLQLTHIQDIVYQFQQQIGCLFHLCSVFCLFLHIICTMICHIDQTADSINRSPDIMAHPLKKLCFCPISGFRLFCSYQKFCFIFFILFPFLFLMFQIGSGDTEPKYTNYQSI